MIEWLKKNILKMGMAIAATIAGILIYLKIKPEKKTVTLPDIKIGITNPNKGADENEADRILSDIDNLRG